MTTTVEELPDLRWIEDYIGRINRQGTIIQNLGDRPIVLIWRKSDSEFTVEFTVKTVENWDLTYNTDDPVAIASLIEAFFQDLNGFGALAKDLIRRGVIIPAHASNIRKAYEDIDYALELWGGWKAPIPNAPITFRLVE